MVAVDVCHVLGYKDNYVYTETSLGGGRGPHSQLGDLHHGQAVRKAVFGKVFRLPERRSLSVTCLAKSLCPKALNTRIAS